MMKTRNKFEEAYHECLEAVQAQGQRLDAVLNQYPELAEELKPRLEAALWLGQQKAATAPRQGYVQASRRRLLARLKQEKKRARWVVKLRAWLFRPAAPVLRLSLSLALAAALFVNVAAVDAAAEISSPGDIFYPLKKAEEQLSLRVTPAGPAELELHLKLAQRRGAEIETLILEGRYEHLLQTIHAFDLQLQQSVLLLARLEKGEAEQAAKTIQALEAVLTNQADMLKVLVLFTPPSNQGAIKRVIRTSETSLTTIQGLQAGLRR